MVVTGWDGATVRFTCSPSENPKTTLMVVTGWDGATVRFTCSPS
ncbi:hypothetical protein [Runella sp.]